MAGTRNKDLQLKDWLRDYLDEREAAIQNKVLSNTTGLIFLGVMIGVILSYTALIPLMIGFILGYLFANNKYLDSQAVVYLQTLLQAVTTLFQIKS